MTIDQLKQQHEQMEGFKAGYQAALQWVAAQLNAEKQAEEAKAKVEHADTVKKD